MTEDSRALAHQFFRWWCCEPVAIRPAFPPTPSPCSSRRCQQRASDTWRARTTRLARVPSCDSHRRCPDPAVCSRSRPPCPCSRRCAPGGSPPGCLPPSRTRDGEAQQRRRPNPVSPAHVGPVPVRPRLACGPGARRAGCVAAGSRSTSGRGPMLLRPSQGDGWAVSGLPMLIFRRVGGCPDRERRRLLGPAEDVRRSRRGAGQNGPLPARATRPCRGVQ
jgi:hypothetical protein